MSEITIRKFDHAGYETWRYTGTVLERGETWVRLQAFFNRPDSDDGYVVFRQGDRFVEHFYSDRWFNVFEIHDVSDDHIKGWYCNFTRPARLDADQVINEDLALDLWIYPNGDMLLLDEDEFEALPILAAEREQVRQSVNELRERVERREPPFDQIEETRSHANN